MSFNPITLVATLIGGLILAGLLGWIRRPRLIVLVSKQFSYSQISDRGHLLELSFLNRGFKTEENVEATLNHALRYELLGANSQDVAVKNNKIAIPRIGSSDEITVLILVEGGSFNKDDIVQCLSKESKGQIITKLEEVPATGPQRVALVGLAVLIPAILYSITIGIDYFFKALNSTPAAEKIAEDSDSIKVREWVVPSYYRTTNPKMLDSFSSGKLLATVGKSTRKGDFVSIPVVLTNNTDQVLEVNISMNSAYSKQKLKSYDLVANGIIVTPGKTSENSVRLIIPENGTAAERTAYINIRVESMTGGSLSFKTQSEIQ